MRPRTSAILATTAAAVSMVLLAGCGGDGPEGAPPPPATTKAAPARSAAPRNPNRNPAQASPRMQGCHISIIC